MHISCYWFWLLCLLFKSKITRNSSRLEFLSFFPCMYRPMGVSTLRRSVSGEKRNSSGNLKILPRMKWKFCEVWVFWGENFFQIFRMILQIYWGTFIYIWYCSNSVRTVSYVVIVVICFRFEISRHFCLFNFLLISGDELSQGRSSCWGVCIRSHSKTHELYQRL